MLRSQPFALLFVASTAASLIAAAIMWPRRSMNTAAGALTFVLLGITVWSAGTAAANVWAHVELLPVFSAVIYPGVCAVVAGFFCYSMAVADRGWRLSRRTVWLLLLEPVAVFIAVVTNPVHHKFFTSAWLAGSPTRIVKSTGPLFYLHTFYSYALLACAVLMLARAWVHAPDHYRPRFAWPLLGVIPPFAANSFAIFIIPGRTVDLTPIGFLGTAVLSYWAWRHDALPDLVPIARQQVLDTIGEAVLVIDRDQRILDLNPAADGLVRRLTPGLPDQIVGLAAPQVLGLRLPLTTGTDVAHSLSAVSDTDPIDLDLRISFVRDRKDNGIGWILVAHDVTQLNTQRRELEAANGQLRDQLATIERLRDDLAEKAVRDHLTGLYNRRYLVDMLDRAVADAAKTSAWLSVILLDIDHFKRVNDRYGHAVGDDVIAAVAEQVIAAVAEQLVAAGRPTETVARYGGEEFVIVLPGSTGEQAVARAETLRRRCAALAVPVDLGNVTITVSAGVSTSTGKQSPAELLNAADTALYQAKAQGRNRVVLAPTTPGGIERMSSGGQARRIANHHRS